LVGKRKKLSQKEKRKMFVRLSTGVLNREKKEKRKRK
jgi:hypothetical protein